jgi:threonine dehydratase
MGPLSWSEVENARSRLSRYLKPTRLIPAPSLTAVKPAEVYLKIESELPTGSFKVRGALCALLSRRDEELREAVAASTGNHGAAVAYAARLLGLRATIFLPRDPNPVKRLKISQLGARIIEHGEDLVEALSEARDYAGQPGRYLVNDAAERQIAIGTATIGCEILEELPDTSAIYVPIGDTALIRGIAYAAKHLSPQIRIIGVQAEHAPAYYLSWKAGHPVMTESCDTIADGLATRQPLDENVRVLRELVDEILLVTEEQMLHAIKHLLFEEHLVTEPAGAAAAAAFLYTSPSVLDGKVVLIMSGSNVSNEILKRASTLG